MKIGQRLFIGFSIIILINVLAGYIIVSDVNSVQQYYQSKTAMDNLIDHLKDCRLTEKGFRSAYDTKLVVDFQTQYKNVTRDLNEMEISNTAYGSGVDFNSIQASIKDYHNLVLQNIENTYSLENLWRSEQDTISSPGGLNDSSSAMTDRVLKLEAEKNRGGSGMRYLYGIQQDERNFLITHDPSYLNDIYLMENLTLTWANDDQVLTEDIWRYNNNLNVLSNLFSHQVSTEGQIDTTVGSLGEQLSSIDADVSSAFETALQRTMITIAALVALSLVSSIVISVIMTRSISRPIASLAQTSEKIAAGDLRRKIEVKGNDEVSSLGRSFQRMVTSMRERIEFNDALVRNIVDAQIIVSPEGKIIYFNNAAKSMTGYSYGEISSIPYDAILDGLPGLSGIRADISRDCVLVRKDGSRVNVTCRLSAVNDGEGARMGTMVLLKEQPEHMSAPIRETTYGA